MDDAFFSRHIMDMLCLQHGVTFPPDWFIRAWTERLVHGERRLEPTQNYDLLEHIMDLWDEGAFRTFYAYFYGDTRAPDVLLHYYRTFHSHYWGWLDRNPSAAAVAVIRFLNVNTP